MHPSSARCRGAPDFAALRPALSRRPPYHGDCVWLGGIRGVGAEEPLAGVDGAGTACAGKVCTGDGWIGVA
jgi:hypothetical protein